MKGGRLSGVVGEARALTSTLSGLEWSVPGRSVQSSPDSLRYHRELVHLDTCGIQDGIAHRWCDAVHRDLTNGLGAERARGLQRLHEDRFADGGVVGPEDPVRSEAVVDQFARSVEDEVLGQRVSEACSIAPSTCPLAVTGLIGIPQSMAVTSFFTVTWPVSTSTSTSAS